jgi:glutathione synthase/RimK-type ligase-like ATP-grasp enzyme
VRAANLMGDGLYGVDLKEIDGKPYVVEVNDNPSLDAGSEDALLGPELYVAIAREFRRRIEQKRSKVPK